MSKPSASSTTRLAGSNTPNAGVVDFGARLRQAREQRGITLRQIAATTKISKSALEALERDDISRLPGGIFTRAFVRSYAAEIGLDPEQTVREFLDQFPDETTTMGGSPPVETTEEDAFESQRRLARALLWLVGLSLPAVLAIVYFSVRGGETASNVPQVPAPGKGAAEIAAPPTLMREQAEPEAETYTSSPPGAAEVTPVVTTAAAAKDSMMVEIRPVATCWVSVTVDGQRAFSRLMQAGELETRRVRDEVILSVGDAGAFGFAINNRAGRSLGRQGEVVTVRINRDNYGTFLTP